MSRETNKEQVLFLIIAVLLMWTLVKLGLFVTRQTRPPGAPLVPAIAAQPGDKAIDDFLAASSLDGYLQRGTRDNPFEWDASQPSQLFVRTTVAHSFLASIVFSRFTYDCRMAPRPVRELRFKLPPRASVADVFSKELDEARKWGVDDRTLVVPVNPTLVRRSYYRCQVAVVLRAPFTTPTQWTAPVVSCTDATPNVQCELGCIAIATPGDHVDLVAPKDVRDLGLTKLALEAVPKELAAQSNKLAYAFARPDYTLTLDVEGRKRVVVAPTTATRIPPVRPDTPPRIGPERPPKEVEPKETEPKLAIPRAGDADTLPFKLTAVVRIHEPEPRRQVVLRDKTTGEYFRKFEGDLVMADLRIASITDDSVVIEDSKGKRYRFAGRFGEKNE